MTVSVSVTVYVSGADSVTVSVRVTGRGVLVTVVVRTEVSVSVSVTVASWVEVTAAGVSVTVTGAGSATVDSAVTISVIPTAARNTAAPMAAPLSPFVTGHIFSPERWPLSVGWQGGGYLALRPRSIAASGRDLRTALDELPALSRRYGELSAPVHVLGAESDALVPQAEHAARLARESGRVRLTLVPGGHMLPITQPHLVAAWLRDVAKDMTENVASEAGLRTPTSPAP